MGKKLNRKNSLEARRDALADERSALKRQATGRGKSLVDNFFGRRGKVDKQLRLVEKEMKKLDREISRLTSEIDKLRAQKGAEIDRVDNELLVIKHKKEARVVADKDVDLLVNVTYTIHPIFESSQDRLPLQNHYLWHR